MADEYIKRSQAIKELTNAYEYEYPTASGAFDEFATTIVPNVLRNIPAADVVEVVRCRDCVHWSEKIGMCLYCYGLHYNAINPSKENSFCSYGERRSE